MSIEETQAVMDAYVGALVAREDIAPHFSDDVVVELVDVGQRFEGGTRWSERSSNCTRRRSMRSRS